MNQARATHGYHHGDLREALLAAAEVLLEAGGIPALTLRAVARAAGVSHAAPAHHFGDLVGLLSELAARGFLRLAEGFDEATAAAKTDASARLAAMGRAYVGFARKHPGLFALMFRAERLDVARPSLQAAIAASRAALRAAVGGGNGQLTLAAAARYAGLWSLVHGYAVLLTENRLRGLLDGLPPGEDADSLLDAMLGAMSVRADGGGAVAATSVPPATPAPTSNRTHSRR